MAVGCFVSVGRRLEEAHARVRLAEELGYDAAYVTHIAARDSLTVLASYVCVTSRIALGTGVVPIYSRTPATMAQTAATLQEQSAGRIRLGIGISHRLTVERWHGQTIDRPVAEMREYVAIVRAMLAGEPPPQGEKWHTSFKLAGIGPYPELPIYVAALSPAMLRLAGEIADGVVLWLCNPEYIRSVVVPEVRAGRERAGKPLDGFDVVAAVPAAVVDDRAIAHASMRASLMSYFALPFYRAMLERSGFGADIAAYDEAAQRSDASGMHAAISEGFLDALCAIGSEDDVAAGVEGYLQAGTTSPCVSPVARTDFGATLRAAAPSR
jgi:alkanesulfonate monooxygenase SsuD/methylene tetrahydromethanopterin reductase-like flavin-dependent oxidoreductase (luciferase family)